MTPQEIVGKRVRSKDQPEYTGTVLRVSEFRGVLGGEVWVRWDALSAEMLDFDSTERIKNLEVIE